MSFTVGSQKELPEKFKKSDQNKNGRIDYHEVNNAIDYYFIGSKGYDTFYVHQLIDYFFEQDN